MTHQVCPAAPRKIKQRFFFLFFFSQPILHRPLFAIQGRQLVFPPSKHMETIYDQDCEPQLLPDVHENLSMDHFNDLATKIYWLHFSRVAFDVASSRKETFIFPREIGIRLDGGIYLPVFVLEREDFKRLVSAWKLHFEQFPVGGYDIRNSKSMLDYTVLNVRRSTQANASIGELVDTVLRGDSCAKLNLYQRMSNA